MTSAGHSTSTRNRLAFGSRTSGSTVPVATTVAAGTFAGGARRLGACGLILLAAACSRLRQGNAGGTMPPDPDAITVIVQNNLMPPTTLTIYIIDDAGTRTRLGQVSGASTDRLFARVPPTGRARLYARSTEVGELTSEFISLRPSQVLEWDVFTNVVTQRFGGAARDTAPAYIAGR